MPRPNNRVDEYHELRKPGYLKVDGIPREAEEAEVKQAIADRFHAAIAEKERWRRTADGETQHLMNFQLKLYKQPDHSGQLKSYGFVLLPCWAGQFLQYIRVNPVKVPYNLVYGQNDTRTSTILRVRDWDNDDDHYKWSRGLINHLKSTPWIDPFQEKKHKDRRKNLEARCQLTSIQFGFDHFELRKGPSFGTQTPLNDHRWCVERAYEYGESDITAYIHFVDAIRTIQIRIGDPHQFVYHFINIRYDTIKRILQKDDKTLMFVLWNAPVFEYGRLQPEYDEEHSKSETKARRRLSGFDEQHKTVVSLFSRQFRLRVYSGEEMGLFQDMATEVGLTVEAAHPETDSHNGLRSDYPPKHRPGEQLVHLSVDNLRDINRWLHELPFQVAWQLAALLHNGLLNPIDITKTMRLAVERLLDEKKRSVDQIGDLLQQFLQRINYWTTEDYFNSSLEARFNAFSESYWLLGRGLSRELKKGYFYCYRARITPTNILLSGPTKEQSNGVIRRYEHASDAFLRVSLTEEDRLSLRWDRGVDGEQFVKERLGKFLNEGLTIAGYKYEFLGYSGSGLKDHTVWFVRRFTDIDGTQIDADAIRRGIGQFSTKLEYQPAKLGARLAQAFSTTESSVILKEEEVEIADDIVPDPNPNGYSFTDGYGCISLELADEIWRILNEDVVPLPKPAPSAYQVRIGGAKGVLGINPLLKGRKVRLHKSMVKFTGNDRGLHIALKFDHPLPLYMNRPLVAVLEHLGVPREWFLRLQERAVGELENALLNIDRAAADFLTSRLLGNLFGFPDIIRSLLQHGITRPILENFPHPWLDFILTCLDITSIHVKRELKFRARIPIPSGLTLVGVADVHGELAEGEVYICTQKSEKVHQYFPDKAGIVYVTRSPSIHPGDVQKFFARHPSPSSIYHKHPMVNCIVFSTRGSRPGPHLAGGGDLDGDLFQIIPEEGNFKVDVDPPAAYKDVPALTLDRRATIEDIGDFVIEFINSDKMGIIAIQHLVISDQSRVGLRDKKCMQLAELHHKAVDFQKNGVPVPLAELPTRIFKYTPDYQSKEAKLDDTTKYYESPKILGVLYRRLKLDSRKSSQATQEDEALQWTEHPIWKLLERLGTDVFPKKTISREQAMPQVRTLFHGYIREIKSLRGIYTVGHLPLSEEEVYMSIIVEQTPDRRRDDMNQMLREATTLVIDNIRTSFRGRAEEPLETCFMRCMAGVELSLSTDILQHEDKALVQDRKEAQRSFGLLALRGAFECLDVKMSRRPDLRKRTAVSNILTSPQSVTSPSATYSSLFTLPTLSSTSTTPSLATPRSPLSPPIVAIPSPSTSPIPAVSTSPPISPPSTSSPAKPRKWANSRLRR